MLVAVILPVEKGVSPELFLLLYLFAIALIGWRLGPVGLIRLLVICLKIDWWGALQMVSC